MSETRKKVVVVEDEPFIKMMIEDMLKRSLMDVVTLSEADNAIETILRERPDAVILDWMMPRISGLELCRQIKSLPELSGIPVMMLTGKGQAEDEERGIEAGADVYQRKPFSPKVLLEQLRKMMDASSKKG